MRITHLFLGVTIASLAQAWRFSLQDILMSEPLVFLRSALQTKEWPVRMKSPALSRMPAPVSCVIGNVEDIAGCACFVAQSQDALTKEDIAFCESLLGLSFQERKRSCDGFRDSSGEVQVYRLIHNIFNVLDRCTVNRIERETKAAQGETTPPKETVKPKESKKPQENTVTPRPANSTVPSTTNPTTPRSPTASPAETVISKESETPKPQEKTVTPRPSNSTVPSAANPTIHRNPKGSGDGIDAGVDDSRVVPQRYVLRQSTNLPFSRQTIWGFIEVLKKIGKILVRIFHPHPSGKNVPEYLNRPYQVICRFKGKNAVRVQLKPKAVRLMLYNDMDIVLPLVDKETLPRSERMKKNGIGVVKCRKSFKNGILRFKCICKRKRKRKRKRRPPG